MENVSQGTEDRLLRIMADQSQEIEAMRKNFSERFAALEKRPRRSVSGLLDLDLGSVASMAMLIIVGLILTRVLIYSLAQMKRRGVIDANPSMSSA